MPIYYHFTGLIFRKDGLLFLLYKTRPRDTTEHMHHCIHQPHCVRNDYHSRLLFLTSFRQVHGSKRDRRRRLRGLDRLFCVCGTIPYLFYVGLSIRYLRTKDHFHPDRFGALIEHFVVWFLPHDLDDFVSSISPGNVDGTYCIGESPDGGLL